MQSTRSIVTKLARATATVCAIALCVSLAACGSDNNQANSTASSTSQTLPKLEGVTAEGTPGEKPKVTFKAPLTAQNNSYAILQEGNGDALATGNRLCLQYTNYSMKTGEEIVSTWEKNVPDCSVVLSDQAASTTSSSISLGQILNEAFKNQKINTTIGLTTYDGNSDSQSYLMVITAVSQSKDLEKAEGTKVTDVPADLPKVTTAEDGKPSIDMNGYKGSDTLVSQTLIEGNGAEITDDTYAAVVKYSGWLLDGTQFDSSWDRNSTFDAVLDGGVIKGWTEGLKGKKVGSQVLLVIPPDLGYGSTAQGSIPANSTLVFVVDILATY